MRGILLIITTIIFIQENWKKVDRMKDLRRFSILLYVLISTVKKTLTKPILYSKSIMRGLIKRKFNYLS